MALTFIPTGTALLTRLIRATALVGYSSVFLSIVSSAFTRELVRLFGRPFIRVHHIVSVTGLAMLVLHPALFAWQTRDLGVFVPSFASLRIFLALGGRLAFYLLGVATVAALLRRPLGRYWRTLHWLNYAAFLLATPHAVLLGGTFQNPFIRAAGIAMTLIVIGLFIFKRLPRRRKR